MGIIYRVTNNINRKIYIGQTTGTLESRWKGHVYDTVRYDYKFSRALKKYGFKCWSREVIEEIDDFKLNEREAFWIEFFNSMKEGYNSKSGGGQAVTYSEEAKKKMSLAKLGKKQSLEHLTNRSTKGMKYKSHKKGPCSEETKKKISIANKGKPSWSKGLCRDTPRKKLAREHNVSTKTIDRWIKAGKINV